MKKALEIGKKGRLSVRGESDRKASPMSYLPAISSRVFTEQMFPQDSA